MVKNNSKMGFTLVELAIVIVIIGLIVGGVLGGQELINGAKLNSVITDFSKYERAVNTFKLKYDALPGDMPNATDYWAGATVGDGDGKISIAESFYAWEMLGFSGITTSYTGVVGGVTAGVAGVNFPQSRYCDNCGFSFMAESLVSASAMGWTPAAYPNESLYQTNHLVFGFQTSVLPTGSAMSGSEAKQVDTKMDDGVAGSGRLLGGDAYNSYVTQPGCVVDPTGTISAPAAYITNTEDIKCALAYTLDVDDQ